MTDLRLFGKPPYLETRIEIMSGTKHEIYAEQWERWHQGWTQFMTLDENGQLVPTTFEDDMARLRNT